MARKSVDVKLKVGSVTFDAELSDIHPKHKRDTDGQEDKWVELKLKTGKYDPRLVTQLLTMHGATCVISLDKLQPELGLGESVSAGA